MENIEIPPELPNEKPEFPQKSKALIKKEFIPPAPHIFKAGEPVIVYENKDHKKLIFLSEAGVLNNRYGTFPHSSFIGKAHGSKVNNSKDSGFVYILKPTPTLITETLSHKTQIIYGMDISMILMKLNVLPGNTVVESGTGSGSLSYSLAHAVQDNGFLFTFEFNLDRVENARKIFGLLGLNHITTLHRDVLAKGFLPQPEDQPYDIMSKCDSVFLDLPKPWIAVPHAKEVLRRGGRICCFSPCIEQVQKNCEELRSQGFVDIETIESLCRNFEKNFKKLAPMDKKLGEKQEDTNLKRPYNELNKVYMTSGAQYNKGHTAYLTFATLY